MKIISSGRSDPGRVRQNNEDAFLVDDLLGLYAVADGIGGHQGGEVASGLAIETLSRVARKILSRDGQTSGGEMSSAEDAIKASLTRAVNEANGAILEAAARDAKLSGMGTTLTAMFAFGGKVCIAHVGDSRAYLFRGGALSQLTEDHSVVAEQIRAGLITADQARKSAYRHIITRSLGLEQEVTVDLAVFETRRNDVFLLCSDGLTEMVEDPELRSVLSAAPFAEAAERLIGLANDHGGVDNITVVVVHLEDDTE